MHSCLQNGCNPIRPWMVGVWSCHSIIKGPYLCKAETSPPKNALQTIKHKAQLERLACGAESSTKDHFPINNIMNEAPFCSVGDQKKTRFAHPSSAAQCKGVRPFLLLKCQEMQFQWLASVTESTKWNWKLLANFCIRGCFTSADTVET